MGTMNQAVEVVVKGVKLNVLVTDDFTVKGSFDPDSESDLDFYGYRETEFEVLRADDNIGKLFEDVLDVFMAAYGLVVEAAIQEQLDKDREDQYVDLSGCTFN